MSIQPNDIVYCDGEGGAPFLVLEVYAENTPEPVAILFNLYTGTQHFGLESYRKLHKLSEEDKESIVESMLDKHYAAIQFAEEAINYLRTL